MAVSQPLALARSVDKHPTISLKPTDRHTVKVQGSTLDCTAHVWLGLSASAHESFCFVFLHITMHNSTCYLAAQSCQFCEQTLDHRPVDNTEVVKYMFPHHTTKLLQHHDDHTCVDLTSCYQSQFCFCPGQKVIHRQAKVQGSGSTNKTGRHIRVHRQGGGGEGRGPGGGKRRTRHLDSPCSRTQLCGFPQICQVLSLPVLFLLIPSTIHRKLVILCVANWAGSHLEAAHMLGTLLGTLIVPGKVLARVGVNA